MRYLCQHAQEESCLGKGTWLKAEEIFHLLSQKMLFHEIQLFLFLLLLLWNSRQH